jgi:hypothetical protein
LSPGCVLSFTNAALICVLILVLYVLISSLSFRCHTLLVCVVTMSIFTYMFIFIVFHFGDSIIFHLPDMHGAHIMTNILCSTLSSLRSVPLQFSLSVFDQELIHFFNDSFILNSFLLVTFLCFRVSVMAWHIGGI